MSRVVLLSTGASSDSWPTAVRDASGAIHVFWLPTDKMSVWHTIVDVSGNVSDSQSIYTFSSLPGTVYLDAIIDSGGTIHLFLSNWISTDILYGSNGSGAFSFTTLPSLSTPANSVACSLHPDGRILVAASTLYDSSTKSGVFVIERSGGSWGSWETIEQDASDDWFRQPRIDIDTTSGTIHLVWYKFDRSLSALVARTTSGDMGSWDPISTIAGSSATDKAYDVDVAVDAAGTPYYIYTSSYWNDVIATGGSGPHDQITWPPPGYRARPRIKSDTDSNTLVAWYSTRDWDYAYNYDVGVMEYATKTPSGSWTSSGRFPVAGLATGRAYIVGQKIPSFARAYPWVFVFQRIMNSSLGYLYIFGEQFPEKASVSFTSPTGGDVLTSTPITISWVGNSLFDTEASSVSLFYKGEGFTDFSLIAEALPLEGSYDWTPVNLDSGTVTLKVEGFDSGGNSVASDTVVFSLRLALVRIGMQTRTGPTPVPDSSWEDWKPSVPLTDASGSPIQSSANKYIQFKATFETEDPEVSPELS